MILLKLAAAALLVGSAVIFSVKEMRRVGVALATARAWQSFLGGVRHEVVSAGMPLSVVLVPLREDAALQSALLGGRRVCAGTDSARLLLRSLCREAATLLPPKNDATAMLFCLGEAFDEALDTEQIGRRLEELLDALSSLQQDLSQRVSGECRARAALYICGALCAVLMLW